MVSIGRYKQSAASPGLTLSEIREQGNKYGAMLQKGIDVADYLKKRREADELRLKESKAAERRGTFEQLLDAYLDKLEGKAILSAGECVDTSVFHFRQNASSYIKG